MFLLAAGASCFCDSYDPDPWDDTPPVTVDFNFVKPQVISTQVSHDKTQRGAIGASDLLHSARVSREPGMGAACAIISNKAPGTPLFSPLRT